MRREVSTSLTFAVDGVTDFVLALAPADGVPVVSESMTVELDGRRVAVTAAREGPGNRLALFRAGSGSLQIAYTATIVGRAAPAVVDPLDSILYTRPSRYAQSDALTDFARERFNGLRGWDLARGVADWVHAHLEYRPELSSPVGGAVETLDARGGVCRDYAHVTAALLRAMDQPARLVSVYAPQLEPMDLHAVVEVLVDGRWLVVDATRLAPRQSLVRVSTGRDAADIAFETNTLNDVELQSMRVEAHADATTPDDPNEPVALS